MPERPGQNDRLTRLVCSCKGCKQCAICHDAQLWTLTLRCCSRHEEIGHQRTVVDWQPFECSCFNWNSASAMNVKQSGEIYCSSDSQTVCPKGRYVAQRIEDATGRVQRYRGTAEHIPLQGDSFEKERIALNMPKRPIGTWLWLSETTAWLKRASAPIVPSAWTTTIERMSYRRARRS